MATWNGMRFGSLMVAASASVPARISGSANDAVPEARIRSQESAIQQIRWLDNLVDQAPTISLLRIPFIAR